MKIIDIPQGSALWDAHRREHRNASDAAAMFGCSPHKSRTELLREVHSGVAAPVDAATEQRFADGHRFEAWARPLAEEIVGEDLYPLVKANGRLSASLDGQTLMADIDWEHKTLNDELREMLPNTGVGSATLGEALPLHYRVQIAHQHYCGGAERTLFTASKWTADGKLIEARHCWVARDEELIARVLAGWEQFEADLAAYKPPEAATVVVAAPLEALPSPSVSLNGSLAVVSNLDRFGLALRGFIDRMPKEPSTDQEFADTDAACKRLKECEDRLQAAEDTALASLSDVETMRTTVATLRELARTTRLAASKLVEARKQQIRTDEVARGRDAFATHMRALAERLGGPYMPPIATDFPGAIKGLKTLDSLKDKIDTELARAKIEANALADRIDANLKAIVAADAPTLFPDKGTLALKQPDDLAAVIAQRLAAEEKRLEAERERIRAEETARAEAKAKADAEAAAAAAPVPAPAPAPIEQPTLATVAERIEAEQAPAPVIDEPVIKLGDVCARLGFTMTAAFVTEALGISTVPDAKGRAVLFKSSDFDRICERLVTRIREVQVGICR